MPHKYTIEFDEPTWRALLAHAGRGNIKEYLAHLLRREFEASALRAVVLCGGRSSALYPTAIPIPKAMLPVNYRPVVEYVLAHLAAHGIHRVTLATGAGGDLVREHVMPLARDGLEIDVVSEPAPLGTGGAVRNVRHKLKGTFLVVNGDILTNADLTALLATHRRLGRPATLLATHPARATGRDTSRFGTLWLAADGAVVRFAEKGAAGAAERGRPQDGPGSAARGGAQPTQAINAGVYVFEPEILRRIPPEGPHSLERDLFPDLAAEGLLAAHPMAEGDYWLDVADPQDFATAWEDTLSGRFPLPA